MVAWSIPIVQIDKGPLFHLRALTCLTMRCLNLVTFFILVSLPIWNAWNLIYVLLDFTSSCIFEASALWADAFYKLKCLSVWLYVRVFTFEVPFKHLFALIYQSQMSTIFRDSESLGKSNGKKWSHIWNFSLKVVLKSPRQKRFFFFGKFTFEVPFKRLFAPISRSQMSKIFRDLESLGKSNGKK